MSMCLSDVQIPIRDLLLFPDGESLMNSLSSGFAFQSGCEIVPIEVVNGGHATETWFEVRDTRNDNALIRCVNSHAVMEIVYQDTKHYGRIVPPEME